MYQGPTKEHILPKKVPAHCCYGPAVYQEYYPPLLQGAGTCRSIEEFPPPSFRKSATLSGIISLKPPPPF